MIVEPLPHVFRTEGPLHSGLAAPGVADAGEDALLARRELAGRRLFPAQLRELAQHLFLLLVELRRRRDDHVHEQVAAPDTAQVRYAAGAQLDDLTGLRARSYVELFLTVERRHLDRRTESGRGHRQRHRAVQVIAVTLQHSVRELVDLDIKIAGRPTTRTDFAFTGEPNAHAVLDPRRDLHGQRATCAHPTV